MPSIVPAELKRWLTAAGTHPSADGLRVLREAHAARWKLGQSRRTLVIEVLRYLFDQAGQNYAELSRRTGLTVDACKGGLALAGLDDPAMQDIRKAQDRALEEVRFQGRKQMIERLWDLGEKLLAESCERYQDMKPRELVSALKDVVSQAQLLSGEATSRIARSDEKFMTEDELERAIADLDRRYQRGAEGAEREN